MTGEADVQFRLVTDHDPLCVYLIFWAKRGLSGVGPWLNPTPALRSSHAGNDREGSRVADTPTRPDQVP